MAGSHNASAGEVGTSGNGDGVVASKDAKGLVSAWFQAFGGVGKVDEPTTKAIESLAHEETSTTSKNPSIPPIDFIKLIDAKSIESMATSGDVASAIGKSPTPLMRDQLLIDESRTPQAPPDAGLRREADEKSSQAPARKTPESPTITPSSSKHLNATSTLTLAFWKERFTGDTVKHLIAGGVAGAVSRTVVSPFERMKILFQVQGPEPAEYKGVVHTLVKMWKEEGPLGFLRGNGTNVVRIVPYSAMQFAAYEQFKLLLMEPGKKELDTPRRLTAGALAGIVSVICTYPLDITRTRLAVQSATLKGNLAEGGKSRKLPGIWGTMRNIYKNEGGVWGLYRGLWPTLLGVAPYVALNFQCYELIKKYLTPPGESQPSVGRKLACGALAGSIAQTVTYPLDVLRRRMQVTGMSSMAYKYKGTWDAAATMIRKEGVLGLYKGMIPNYLKVAPAISVSFVVDVIEGLRKVYNHKIKPLEVTYNFEAFHSSPLTYADISAKPLVLLIGQYSTGKTTFIKYLIENDYPGEHIGVEPTTDRFVAVMHGDEDRVIPGNAAAVDVNLPFRSLNRFGQAFLSRFQVSQTNSPVLENMTFIDTPGVLAGDKQTIDRGYDFTAAVEYFAERADMVILLFDCNKLDISNEFKSTIRALRGQEEKVKVVLNKSDMVSQQELMRVYGAMMWSLGKVVQTPEVMRVYIGSFWTEKPSNCLEDNRALIDAEHADLLKDLRDLPKNSAMRKINTIVKRARLAKVHACIVGQLKNDMPAMFGKKKKQQELIANLDKTFLKIQQRYHLSPGDFPNVERFKSILSNWDLDKFKSLKPEMIQAAEDALANDLPKLIAKFPQGNRELSKYERNPFETFDPPADGHHKRSFTGYTKDKLDDALASVPSETRAIWEKYSKDEPNDIPSIEESIVKHTHSTLARNAYNMDNFGAYQATAHSVRDRLIKDWNDTQQANPKRVYYLSLEFLLGRSMDNALLALGLKDKYTEGVKELGFNMEDLLQEERDAALGNGGLGRLAACYMDSLATLDYPAWGYGLRYTYGIFQQKLVNGYQTEYPDYWLNYDNPWEFPRLDIAIEVPFYGHVSKYSDEQGRTRYRWDAGEVVQAVAYDVPIPGYDTKNTINIRLWSSKPRKEFDLSLFNAGDYDRAVEEQKKAENITSVLYPNDNHMVGKELRLKQQFFWVCASLHDIVRRFKKTSRPWSEFPDQVAIQLNDTHPTLAIPELMRVLVDLEGLDWDDAWDIVTRTFGFTNHTVLPEALEKWSVPMLENILPRHLQIIFDINLFFLQGVEAKFPNDRDLLRSVSVIEEGSPQFVRMAYLAVIGSHKVNGVAALHSEIIAKTIFADFVRVFGRDKFTNKTNGITPRRWLHQCNPELSDLITETLSSSTWVKHLSELSGLAKHADDKALQRKWMKVKYDNKVRLAALIKARCGYDVNPDTLFDIQVKRIHEYKRQFMNILGVIHRYLTLKKMSAAEKKNVVPRTVIFGGKAAPGYYIAKLVIKLITSVGEKVNNDPDIGDLLKVIFIPDYNVSLAEVIIPANDISQHISTAGTEASGTSNMKFVLNGGIILGTVDGANIEIWEEIGDDNIFLFGCKADQVEDLRHAQRYRNVPMNPDLETVIQTIESGTFGDAQIFQPLINTITIGKDYYLISVDFASYLESQDLVDAAYRDKESWAKKSILCTAYMGKFSSDRAIKEYAEQIWSVEPVTVPRNKSFYSS
ncbi:hypothetical protein BZG36_03986 [Bifiguratus adelaidae]|uniref:Alpha-1,4 glucan phosphorylase n=1 Tax=Bifiguratus adelaidae TaxID=1938954 RepID=A0A261Y1N6_9FUNG|nr:hypothetical protein BZG36_03986 [Bifiguratus adelaidae]